MIDLPRLAVATVCLYEASAILTPPPHRVRALLAPAGAHPRDPARAGSSPAETAGPPVARPIRLCRRLHGIRTFAQAHGQTAPGRTLH